MKIAFPLRMPTRKKRAYRINEISNTSNLVLTIVMTILAIAYPFFQKYFVKGLTVGSVKG